MISASEHISGQRHSLLGGVSAAIIFLFAPQANALDENALPSDGTVMAGDVSLDYAATNELHIYQQTDRGVINWDSFNTGRNSLTQFHQPSSSSLTVNRVIGNGDPTQILGRLSANGRLLVLDRNGVIFGQGSQVDVGGIIVSTGDIQTNNAMNDAQLNIYDVDSKGFIINNGFITIAEAGLAAFVSPTIVNNGIIQAKLGRIDIGAGSDATIDLYGDGLVALKLNASMEQALTNNGILHADGGTVAIQAAAAKDIVDNIINNTGIIAANSIGQDATGKIILSAGGSNKSLATGSSVSINNGYLTAAGNDQGQKGGSIDILGDVVVLGNDSLMDASGDTGGGNIRIGGDYLGKGDTPPSRYTYVAGSSLILNDAFSYGDGGRTIIWSDDTTDFHGSILARGGVDGGNGGFVETSGKMNLLADGYVDLTASKGEKGTYLLDPADITIYGNFAPNYVSTDTTLNLASLLTLWLDASAITSLADGDPVASLPDLSGNNNNAVQAGGNKPTYVANGLNGKGVVRFDGTTVLSTLSSVGITGNSARYMSALMNSSIGGNKSIVGYGVDGPGNIFDMMVYNTSIIGHFYGGGFDTLGGSPAFTIGTWSNATLNYDGSLLSVYTNGAFGNSKSLALNTINSGLRIGGGTYAPFNYFQGDIAEVFLYSDDLNATQRGLLDQYQAAKWGVGLLNPNPATEASIAMDTTTGYGAFTTRYLERLSNTADIVLQATNSITLDLKGDTLSLANDRSISLTTTTGDIKTLSSGGITTNRTGTGGNITMTAGDDIAFNHAFTLNAQNGGQINLTANDGVSASGHLTIANGNLNIGSQIITGTYTGKDALMNSHAGNINATVSFDNLDINGASATLLDGYIGAPGAPTQTMANLIKINGASGSGSSNYTFAGFKIGATNTNAVVTNKISNLIQQSTNSDSPSANSGDDLLKGTRLEARNTRQGTATADCLITLENVGCVVQ